MPRLMSVALTEAAVRDRSKTVTRRLGWTFLRPGDRITLCRKTRGRRTGEPLVRICDVTTVSVRREPLNAITAAEVTREGFDGWAPAQFIAMFTKAMRCHASTAVTRIEWTYPDKATTGDAGRPPVTVPPASRSPALTGFAETGTRAGHSPAGPLTSSPPRRRYR